MTITSRFYLLDGPLMPLTRLTSDDTVSIMADLLRQYRVRFNDEAGAIRVLSGRGFSASEISFHLYDARVAAAEDI
jgi:hypothetical protein